VLLGIAIGAAQVSKSVLDTGLKIASVPFGALLGVFLLGVLTRRANERGSMVGMALGFLANVYIWQGSTILRGLQSFTGVGFARLALERAIPFPWDVLIGSTITFAVGYCASLLLASANNTSHGTNG
jgi:Na+/proline symporter